MSKPSVPFKSMLRALFVLSSPAVIVLAFCVAFGLIDFSLFFYASLAIVLVVAMVTQPILANLAALTQYVEDLANDRKTGTLDLGVLNAVGELSTALVRLHRSWDKKKQEMESVITEREILVDTLPDILIMINDAQMVVRTNRAARNIFGQNLANRKLKEVIDNDVLLNGVMAVTDDLKGRELEFHMEAPEPRDFRAIIERFPIPSEGGISVIITLNNITELKRVQKMRADFVANASHEIRTPLASIAGFVETLRGPAKDDPVARDEFLKIMGEQALRMTNLINDLLSLSKIEMNAHTLPKGKADLVRIIRMERDHFEWAMKEKNMALKLDFNDNLPPARGDESELRQVIHNLIGNAIKYSLSDSEIVVTARVTSSLPYDPNFVKLDRALSISVRDQGEGIPKEHIPRLTERFYRVDSARTRSVGGTGLGLAIVKHILNRHRGALTIDSVVGQGSNFTVYLPVFEER